MRHGSDGATYAAFAGCVIIGGSNFIAVSPSNMNAIGMAAGTALLALGSIALREPWVLPRATDTLLAVTWLVLFGSVGLFQLFLYVVKRWTASAAVYAVAGMPVIAVALGALILDQPVTAEVVAGGAIVVAAVYVGAISGPKRSTRPAMAQVPVLAMPGDDGYAD